MESVRQPDGSVLSLSSSLCLVNGRDQRLTGTETMQRIHPHPGCSPARLFLDLTAVAAVSEQQLALSRLRHRRIVK